MNISFQTKERIKRFLHPFKTGFWCIMNFHKLKFGMLWESYDGWSGEWDYGFNEFYNGNRITFKQLKNYENFGFASYDICDGVQFPVPFFIAYILLIPGTIINNYEMNKKIKYYEKRLMEIGED